MTQAEYRVADLAIRQMRRRVEEQHAVLRPLPQRFPAAFCEALEELLVRFERRLNSERIEISPADGLRGGKHKDTQCK